MSEREWTPTIGLSKALVSLITRAIPAAAIWCGAVWLALPALNKYARIGIPMGAGAFGLGLLTGVILSRKLADRAGFVSPLLLALAGGFAALVIMGGTYVAEQIRVPIASPHRRYLIEGIAIICALGLSAKNTLMDD